MAIPLVLVVHPDPAVGDALEACLAGIGVRCRRLADGGELRAALHRLGPDVVLMPFTPGAASLGALLRAVREVTPLARTVLVARPDDVAAGCEVPGAFDCVAAGPGIDPGGVAFAVQQALDRDPAAGAVLVVEDAAVNLEMIADVLHARGYRVLRAGTGEDALAIAAEAVPDMVLMDIYLPGMTGIEAVRELKVQPRTGSIPVVMLSANGSDAAVATALEAGAIDFVVKPFSPRELLARVALVIEKRARLAHA